MAKSLYDELPLFVQDNVFDLVKSPGTIVQDFIWNNESYKLRIQPAGFKIDGIHKVFFPGKIEKEVGQAVRKLAAEHTHVTDRGTSFLSFTLSEIMSLLSAEITGDQVMRALNILTTSSFDILKDEMHLGFSLISSLYHKKEHGETHFQMSLNEMIFESSKFITQALRKK